MKTIDFTVPGKPKGKARPRFANGAAYTDKGTREYEQQVTWAFMEATNGEALDLDAPISLSIYARFKPNKGDSKRTVANKVMGLLVPAKKPDVDNVAKIIMDGLNKVAYNDDAQVVTMLVNKAYDDEECVKVIVTYLEGRECG